MKWITTSFIILNCLSNTALFSQNKTDLQAMRGVMSPSEKQLYSFELGSENEAVYSVKLLFTVYKNFFSSQDMQVCNFHPSCSEYAVQSVEKKGLIIGSLRAFDRLTRCHPLSRGNYPVHEASGLMYDPVE